MLGWLFGRKRRKDTPPAVLAQAQAYLEGKTKDPSVYAIEKDPARLREAIRSGNWVEVTEDTFVTLITTPDGWLDEEHRREHLQDLQALGYPETLFVQRFPGARSHKVPPLFRGSPGTVDGQERYVTARFFSQEDGEVLLWVEGRTWKDDSGRPGALTCDFFLKAQPLEADDWVERTVPAAGEPHRVLVPARVAAELGL
jgi:hypothetical protein